MHLAPSLQAVPCRLCRFTATSRDHHFFLRPFQISGLPALDPRSVTFVLESTTVVYRLLTNRGAPSRPPLVYFFNDVLSVRPVRTRRTCRSRVVLDRKISSSHRPNSADYLPDLLQSSERPPGTGALLSKQTCTPVRGCFAVRQSIISRPFFDAYIPRVSRSTHTRPDVDPSPPFPPSFLKIHGL